MDKNANIRYILPLKLEDNSMNKNNEFYQLIDSYHELVAQEQNPITDKDELFCECFCVSYNDIIELCPTGASFDKNLIQEKLSLGLGCGQCFKRIDKLSVDLYISSKEN
jgi:NAD(P)H-nitrite reductase large subunit